MTKTLAMRRLRRILQLALADESTSNFQSNTRRQFLINASKTALMAHPLLTAAACASSQIRDTAGDKKSDTKNENDVIILGGGIAGLTAAYNFTKKGIACRVYEASPRFGGRMMTAAFNSEGMTCELGGELVDTNHKELFALCAEFGISIDPFAEEEKDLTPNLYYFQKKFYKDEDVVKHFRKLARKIKADAQAIEKDEKALKKFDHMTLEKYLQSVSHLTEPWVLEMLRVAYVGEMGLEANELSTLSLLYIISADTSEGFQLYGESDQAYRIRGGNRALIQALTDFLKSKSVPMLSEHQLINIQDKGDKISLDFSSGKKTVSIEAERVICTLPFSTLREVEGLEQLKLRPQKLDCIRHLSYGTNSKLMLGFKERIWRTQHQSNGMVYTDLPVQNTWDSSRLQKGRSGILTNYLGGNEGRSLGAQMYQPYLQSAEEIFAGSKLVHDGKYLFFNWSQYSFNKGSYSTLRTGEVTRFGSVAYETELGGRLHFAGEHATEKFGGFMNGGCYSGLRASNAIASELPR